MNRPACIPTIKPDPFRKADGSRITTREEWCSRRAEIKAMLEHYDVGEKPGKPSTFKATLQGNVILIKARLLSMLGHSMNALR